MSRFVVYGHILHFLWTHFIIIINYVNWFIIIRTDMLLALLYGKIEDHCVFSLSNNQNGFLLLLL